MEPTEHTPEKPERLYRCNAASVEGFVQQVAVSYIRTGHYFYVPGRIKPDVEPSFVDAKIIDRYDVNVSRWTRALRKQRGEANLQYIRHGRFFLIMATHGTGRFFDLEGEQVKDCRRIPIKFEGYSLSFRGGHAHVRLNLEEYDLFKAAMVEVACRLNRVELEQVLGVPRYAPYAPVRRQLWNIWREVNRVRAAAGLEPVTQECLPLRRRIVRPFGEPSLAVVPDSRPRGVVVSVGGVDVDCLPIDHAGESTVEGEERMDRDDEFAQLQGPVRQRNGLIQQPKAIPPEDDGPSPGVVRAVWSPTEGEKIRRQFFAVLTAGEHAAPQNGQEKQTERPAPKSEPAAPPAGQTVPRAEFPAEWGSPTGESITPTSDDLTRDPRLPGVRPSPDRPGGRPR